MLGYNFNIKLYGYLFLFYFIEILFKINTPDYDKGKIIMERFEIYCNYFKRYFIEDIII